MKTAHNFKDITGKRYGYLTAIEPRKPFETYNEKTGRTIKRAAWLFRCDCGKEIVRARATCEQFLKHGYTSSCGCMAGVGKVGNKHGLWKGYGEISLTHFNGIKANANKGGRRTRTFEFDLTIKYLWELFLSQSRRCALTGEELCFGTLAKVKNKEKREPTASLDRIDSTKGYVVGNVQWVHKKINLMKQAIPSDEFIEWCKKVTKHNNAT